MAKYGVLLFDKPTVIVACDVSSFTSLSSLVEQTCDVPGIGGYKLGFSMGLKGLDDAVATICEFTDKPVIYDHQKAGTDIPDTGKSFAQAVAEAGVDAAILFPFGGGVTERAWIEALHDEDVIPIVGGEMTHKGFLRKDGGFIADGAPREIYRIAAENGVCNFVVPGNKAESVTGYVALLDEILGPGNYTVSAPGFITQGGEISDFAQVAGDVWAAIVGRGIYGASDIRAAAWNTVAALGYKR